MEFWQIGCFQGFFLPPLKVVATLKVESLNHLLFPKLSKVLLPGLAAWLLSWMLSSLFVNWFSFEPTFRPRKTTSVEIGRKNLTPTFFVASAWLFSHYKKVYEGALHLVIWNAACRNGNSCGIISRSNRSAVCVDDRFQHCFRRLFSMPSAADGNSCVHRGVVIKDQATVPIESCCHQMVIKQTQWF